MCFLDSLMGPWLVARHATLPVVGTALYLLSGRQHELDLNWGPLFIMH